MNDGQQLNSPQQAPDTVPAPGYQNFRSSDPRRKSPFFAGLLSLMPGLGQIYVGYYQRGFINVIVAGAVLSLLIAGAESNNVAFHPLGVTFLIFFELYNIIDASRRAMMYNLSLDGVSQIELPDDFTEKSLGGSYIGGIALLVFGLIAISNTLFGFSLEWVESLWPLAPIALGAYLVYKAYQDQQTKDGLPADSSD